LYLSKKPLYSNFKTVAFISGITLFVLVFCQPLKSSAQLWTYLNYNPKAEEAFEKALDKEACSLSMKTEILHGEKSTYKVRTYCIQSFDGLRADINVSERSHGHNLSIQGPNDNINIEDISGLVKVHLLRPELLEIVYRPRGGSDQGFDYVMILGIDKRRLRIVTEFLTINEYSIPDEYHLYEVRLKLQGQTLHNCKLAVVVRESLHSDTNRSKNYDRKSVYVLSFDEDRKIFYNKIQHLNAVLHMDTPAGNERPVSGDFPIVDFGSDEKYYYINDTWYALIRDNASKKNQLSRVH
jgi:hypothetical protein